MWLDHLAVAAESLEAGARSSRSGWECACSPAGGTRISARITCFWGWRTGFTSR